MSDRRRLLMRSSENLSQLIQLALMHEENINNEYTGFIRSSLSLITPQVAIPRTVKFVSYS